MLRYSSPNPALVVSLSFCAFLRLFESIFFYNMPKPLLVLAAGMGSRYGGLKQIDPVGAGGETLMDYSVYDALRPGFDKVIFVILHSIEENFKQKTRTR